MQTLAHDRQPGSASARDVRAARCCGMLAAMSSRRTIVLTGGGTAGHVTPNLALLPLLRARGYHVEYVGSYDGIERRLCAEAQLPYHAISVGKLRRYASWQNLVDPFRTVWGVAQTTALLGRLRPRVVFSKGGFASVPVVIGAALRRIPSVVHESDLSPGLANRLSFPFASRICVAYQETLARIPKGATAVHTGTPIRPELLAGDRTRGLARFTLEPGRPTVLVFGGSLGARALNEATRALVRKGSGNFQFIHVCGGGNLDPELNDRSAYRQFEYLHAEFADALACADAVVARGGANSLSELMALRKPAIIVPLPAEASRGDQIENAHRFAERGYGIVLPQAELNEDRLRSELGALLASSERFVAAMGRDAPPDSASSIVALLDELAGGSSPI
jgi:UDP-N-acetylglucosamine--N-acetylmuramyl-(pentapeptide) pyrophosphoryl-undecaprenol N-acetylglucosamine transferase